MANIYTQAVQDIKNAFSMGVFHLFGSLVITQILAFLLNIFLARILGPANLGHIRVIQAVLQLVGIVAGFGMYSAIAKYSSEYQDDPKKRLVFSQGTYFSILIAFITASVLFILVTYTSLISDEIAKYYLGIICWILPFTVITQDVTAYLQGLKRIQTMSKVNMVLGVFMAFVIGSLSYFYFLNGWVGGMIFYGIVSALFLVYLMRKYFVFQWDKEIFKRMFKFGFYGTGSGAFSMIVLTIDTLMISEILKDAELVGYYGVAVVLVTGLMMIPNSITGTAFPYISEKGGDLKWVWEQLWRLTKRVAFIMIPVCLVIFTFAPLIIGILYGEEYMPAVDALRVLVIASIVKSLIVVSGTLRVAVGRNDIAFWSFIPIVFANVVLNFFLIQYYGIIGAAVATLITHILNYLSGMVLWVWMLNGKI